MKKLCVRKNGNYPELAPNKWSVNTGGDIIGSNLFYDIARRLINRTDLMFTFDEIGNSLRKCVD